MKGAKQTGCISHGEGRTLIVNGTKKARLPDWIAWVRSVIWVVETGSTPIHSWPSRIWRKLSTEYLMSWSVVIPSNCTRFMKHVYRMDSSDVRGGQRDVRSVGKPPTFNVNFVVHQGSALSRLLDLITVDIFGWCKSNGRFEATTLEFYNSPERKVFQK